MTVKEAREIEERYYGMSDPSEEDDFLYTEAMDFLIREENLPEDMMQLDECLGYIWYYGRTGERDYEKAFRHYVKSMERGNLVSTYKVADMYKNGYFVEKDPEKYREIIEELYPKVKNARNLGAPLPEVFTRLARIRKEQGRMEDAADLYLRAKDFLAQRISYNAFFGNLNIMKWLIDDLYKIRIMSIFMISIMFSIGRQKYHFSMRMKSRIWNR